MCIEIIEDEEGILEMLTDMLALAGYTSVGVTQPELAIACAETHQPNLFLIDIMLPGTSGVEIAGELRSAGCTDTPMIAMSASRTMVEVALQSGLFQDAIHKPFELNELFEHIEHLLGSGPVTD